MEGGEAWGTSIGEETGGGGRGASRNLSMDTIFPGAPQMARLREGKGEFSQGKKS